MGGLGDASNSAEDPHPTDSAATHDHEKELPADSVDDVAAGATTEPPVESSKTEAVPPFDSVEPADQEVMVVTEPESSEVLADELVIDEKATTTVDASDLDLQSDEPMAIADAPPNNEPTVIAESEAPNASLATAETQSASTPMVIAEPTEPTTDSGDGAPADGGDEPESASNAISSEPLVIAQATTDAESTVVAESVIDQQELSEPLVVAEPAPAVEPMVVAEGSGEPGVGAEASSSEAAVEPAPAVEPMVVAEGSLAEGSSEPSADATLPSPGDVASGELPPQPVSSRAPGDPGKIVEGVVTAVTGDGVELTLDDGRPAFISRRNFGLNDEAPDSVLSIGDRAHGAELSREDPKSRVVLSRSWALKKQAWDKIVLASTEGKPLTGRVVSGSKKGVVVDVGVRGFVPMSHLELDPVTDLAPYIDQSFELKVLEVDAQKEKLVLSRRSALLKEQRKQIQEFISGIKPGEIRTGKVSSFADYGAFIDLGGVNGLAHISELSWDRVGKPSDVLSLGQEVEVKVLDVKAKKKRISLSLRQTSDDPLSSFEVGSILNGPVTRLVDFGAFVLVQGFEGLVHLSELAEYRVSAPEEIVTPGDVVGVKVLSIDTKRRRLELSIRRAAEYQG